MGTPDKNQLGVLDRMYETVVIRCDRCGVKMVHIKILLSIADTVCKHCYDNEMDIGKI